MSEPVLLHRDGTVATLTLNRPDVLNTLDFAMVEALVARTAEIAADDSLRVVVLRGAGKHFMAGGDIRTFAGELRASRRMSARHGSSGWSSAFTRRSSICTACLIPLFAACKALSPASDSRS